MTSHNDSYRFINCLHMPADLLLALICSDGDFIIYLFILAPNVVNFLEMQ